MMNPVSGNRLGLALLAGGAVVLGCGVVGSMVGWHYGAMLGSAYGAIAEVVVGLTAGALGGLISTMASIFALE